MPSMTERKCKNKSCGKAFNARTADVARGWAKFCSKSCKAVQQERRTGQYGNYLHSGVSREKYQHYAREYGGIPQFDRRGEYAGFVVAGGFDNTEHQDRDRD